MRGELSQFEELYLIMNKRVTKSRDKYEFIIILIAGKKAISRKCLKTEVPKMEDGVAVMYSIYTMEALTFVSDKKL